MKRLPRISFEVDENLRKAVDMHIPWGSLRPIYTHLTRELIDILVHDKDGVILGALFAKRLKITFEIPRDEETADATARPEAIHNRDV